MTSRPSSEWPAKKGASGKHQVWLRTAAALSALLCAMACILTTSMRPARGDETVLEQVVQFSDVTATSGVDFLHTQGASGEYFVVEAYSAGLAIFDFDQDGWNDIYFLNGAALPGAAFASPPTNALYRNTGDGNFVDVTNASGLGDTGYGLGVAVADVNNDGFEDVYVTNFGPNVLYINNGDGTFSNATRQAGVSDGERFSAGAVFADFNGDGNVDLYSANYQQFELADNFVRTIGNFRFHPGPNDFPPDSDSLFLNSGDGSFVDASQASGIADHASTGMGVLAYDFDRDGDQDIFVANDTRANYLFVNDGNAHFQEQAFQTGFALDRNGKANGSMGLDSGDVNGDGVLDVLMTTYQDELPVLYHGVAGGFFDDATNLARIESTLFPHVNWGVGLVDFDNDTDLDGFIACGHFMDNVREIDDRTDVRVTNYLLLNDGRGRYRNATSEAGDGLQIIKSSRGAAFDDLDNDGDIDVVVLNASGKASVLRNELPAAHSRWLDVRLIGTRSNRSAIGAEVVLKSAAGTQIRKVHAGRGYQSHYGTRLHFGLSGDSVGEAFELQVTWPSGQVQLETVSGSGRVVTLLER